MNKILQKLIHFFSKKDRIHILMYICIALGVYILLVTAKYTIVEHKYYQELADFQQVREVKNQLNRGTIYSDDGGILATSAELSNLAIDPQQIGNKPKLRDFLAEVVYNQLCKNKKVKLCYNNVLDFLRVYELEGFTFDETYIQDLIKSELDTRLSKEYVSTLLMQRDVSATEKQLVEELEDPALYFYVDNLYISPAKVQNKGILARQLSTILGREEAELEKYFQLYPVRYLRIASKLDTSVKKEIEEYILKEDLWIEQGYIAEEDSIGNFIILEGNPTRFYPENELAAGIIGFTDNAGQWQYGIEGFFDHELTGAKTKSKLREDIFGRTIESFELETAENIDGSSIHLTIDRNIQKSLQNIIENAVERTRSNQGSAIVMDPNTGAILGMASAPSYDINDFGNVYELEKFVHEEEVDPIDATLGIPVFTKDEEEGDKYYFKGEEIFLSQASEEEIINENITKYIYKNRIGPAVYQNMAISSPYEPGSVFKAFTVGIGLDTEEITPNELYNDRGYVEIDNFIIRNLINEKCQGIHSFQNSLNFSCNVGMIKIADRIWKPIVYDYLKNLGFGEKTGITLYGEHPGNIAHYEKWSRAKLFTTSFGQGLTTTMLQMATAYSAIANGGIYMQPYIVEERTLPSGKTITHVPQPLRRVFTEKTSSVLTEMLVEGVEEGFAKSGWVSGYSIAGKTGTSQIANRGIYEEGGPGRTITSFGGFAPANNPKFVVIVRLDRPRSSEFSSQTSSPVFAEIMEYLLGYANIPKNQ